MSDTIDYLVDNILTPLCMSGCEEFEFVDRACKNYLYENDPMATDHIKSKYTNYRPILRGLYINVLARGFKLTKYNASHIMEIWSHVVYLDSLRQAIINDMPYDTIPFPTIEETVSHYLSRAGRVNPDNTLFALSKEFGMSKDRVLSLLEGTGIMLPPNSCSSCSSCSSGSSLQIPQTMDPLSPQFDVDPGEILTIRPDQLTRTGEITINGITRNLWRAD